MRRPKRTPQPQVVSRILIVDNHPLLRRGLTALIENEPDLRVCTERAATLRETQQAIATARPHLVLLTDLSIMIGDVLEMLKQIRLQYQSLPLLLLALDDVPLYAERAFAAGASGYVNKQAMSETLIVAIRCVLRGERYVSPKMGSHSG